MSIFRIPTTELPPQSVTLDQFDEDDIAAYLIHCGYSVSKPLDYLEDSDSTVPLLIPAQELQHIESLLLTGQRDHAREWALGIISKAIGRTL